ncbi:hypothetical protein HQ585_20595 [candidate division KSB1 bacterium]|nr:hypothetical protein [candidate division KSB1 bacterium]
MVDERYFIHRLKSTSLAGIVAAVLMGASCLYQLYVKGVFRYDLFGILIIMAAVKLGAMFYFRRTN